MRLAPPGRAHGPPLGPGGKPKNVARDIFLARPLILKESIEIDILINNAGITNDSLFIRMALEKWRNVININLNSN